MENCMKDLVFLSNPNEWFVCETNNICLCNNLTKDSECFDYETIEIFCQQFIAPNHKQTLEIQKV